MKRERVRPLWEFHHNGIILPFLCVVLSQLDAKPSSLYANSRIYLRIEARRPPQNLSGDLVLLQSEAWMVKGVFGKVPKQFAQRLGAAQAMTIRKLLYLLEALLPPRRESVRHSHLTTRNNALYLTATGSV